MNEQRRDDEDRAADGGSARYGQRSGSGNNAPKRGERKEQHEDWVPRQGGDQTRSGDQAQSGDEAQSGDQARSGDQEADR